MKDPHIGIQIVHSSKADDRNLGKAYNTAVDTAGEWHCFIDYDAMFVNPSYYRIMQGIIEKYPEYDLFTCLTNRVGCPYQLADVDKENHDIRYHRKMAKRIEILNKDNEVTDITNKLPYLSGMMMLFSSFAYRQVDGFCDGFLGVDNDFHKRFKNAGLQVGLINTLYIYHWYRGQE